MKVTYKKSHSDTNPAITCGCMVLILIFNIFVGGWSVNYLLPVFGLATVPFIFAAAIGLVGGEVTVPLAVIVVILRWAGVM